MSFLPQIVEWKLTTDHHTDSPLLQSGPDDTPEGHLGKKGSAQQENMPSGSGTPSLGAAKVSSLPGALTARGGDSAGASQGS